MKNLKKTLIAVALASVSDLTLANQWTSIDNLVTASDDIRATFDAGLKRVGGVMSYAPVGGISQDGYLTTVHMDQAKADAYNNAVMEVQNDTFMQMDAEQYMANQQVTASDAFSAAVDNYVAASYIFIEATAVNNLAHDAQMSGDVAQAQAVQAYVTDNNVLITSQNVTDYNDALDTVELAGEVWATVEAVYADAQAVQGLQQMAIDNGFDFVDASDMFLDRFQTGTEVAVVEFLDGANNIHWLTIDVSANLKTIQEMNNAGSSSDFYTTGPTQDECFFGDPTGQTCPLP